MDEGEQSLAHIISSPFISFNRCLAEISRRELITAVEARAAILHLSPVKNGMYDFGKGKLLLPAQGQRSQRFLTFTFDPTELNQT